MSQSRVFNLLSSPFESATTIIEASAGTGKTYCLTGLVLRALLERRVEGARQLLVVTFTHAATDELVGRIRDALATARAVLEGEIEPPDDFFAGLADRFASSADGDPTERRAGNTGASILRHALLDIDDLTVATIHGFCKRVLDEAAFEGGLPFDIDLVESDEDLWLDASRDVWRRLLADPDLETTLLPSVLAERQLVPGSFREDYREWRRHPRTELLPTALPIPEAIARLEVARQAAAASFDRVRWRMALSKLRFKPSSKLAAAKALRSALAAAAGFLSGHEDGLWALELLHPAALRLALESSSQTAVDALPGSIEIEHLYQALETLVHAVRAHVLEQVDQRFLAAKKLSATHSFDDLLHQLRGALVHPSHGPRLRSAVRARYRMALIDEFQDTDLVQYDIFRRLFGDGPLLLVGDPKQAIYRFRGADVFAYLGAKREAERLYTLNRNWRSGGDLLSALNAIFQGAPRPFVEEDIPYPEASAAPQAAGRRLGGDDLNALVWLWLDREPRAELASERILTATAQGVTELLAANTRLEDSSTDQAGQTESIERALRPRDIAILVRTNAQAQVMQERLRELGVPAVLSRSGDIFRSDELEELLRLIDAVLVPRDAGRLRAACATVLWGEDAEALLALSEDDGRFGQRVEEFETYRTLWLGSGFIAMMEALLRDRRVRHRLAGLERGERRLTNLQHAVELAHQAAHEHHLSPTGLAAWLRAERQSEAHDRSAVELRLESDDEAVQLVTVHKSKGLEYEVVFCPFLWQSRPVDRAPVLVHETPDKLVYDCGSERLGRHLQLAESERLAEDLRLTYVALTRARRRCYVVWGPIGRGPRSAKSGLAWLLHRVQSRLPDSAAPIDNARRVADGLSEVAERSESWLQDLEELVAENASAMSLRIIDAETGAETFTRDAGHDVALEAALLDPTTKDRLLPWRIASFSSLTRGVSHEAPEHVDLPSSPAASRIAPQGIFAFARGPRAGDCLHRIFEEIDFTEPRGERIKRVVRSELRRFRLGEDGQHAREAPADFDPEAAVLEMVQRVLEKDLAGGLRLAEVDRASRLVEWQFYAPLAATATQNLAATFRRHVEQPWSEEYAARLEQLSDSKIEGFLTGFVDLIAFHGGRWYVVDWKSNHLGDHIADYDLAAMTRAMIDHDYFLQAHLYAVAIDRFLRLHQRDWDFARDFGGVYYIFLRGVDSTNRRERGLVSDEIEPEAHGAQLGLFATEQTAASGIFHLQPSPRLIEALAGEVLAPGVLDSQTATGIGQYAPRGRVSDPSEPSP